MPLLPRKFKASLHRAGALSCHGLRWIKKRRPLSRERLDVKPTEFASSDSAYLQSLIEFSAAVTPERE